MSAITASRTERHSMGDLTMHIFTFSAAADTDTFASGLGTNVVGQWANSGTNEGTAGDEGWNVAESSGTFTFYGKTSSSTTKLFVLSTT